MNEDRSLPAREAGDRQRAGGPFLSTLFSGAPLDAAKLVAAVAMLAGHINLVLFGNELPYLWRISRISFPIFSFAVAHNLLRGVDKDRYFRMFIVLGVITQPIYKFAFPWTDVANVVFTLAMGAALADILRALDGKFQHAALAIGAAVGLTFPLLAQTAVDGGTSGMLLPAALLLLMEGKLSHLPWLVLLVLSINLDSKADADSPWLSDAAIDTVCALGGAFAVLSMATMFRHRARFLRRYAFHVFYPGHLAILAVLRAILL